MINVDTNILRVCEKLQYFIRVFHCSSIVVVVVVAALLFTAGQTMGGLHLDCLGETDGYYPPQGGGRSCGEKDTVAITRWTSWLRICLWMYEPGSSERSPTLQTMFMKRSPEPKIVCWVCPEAGNGHAVIKITKLDPLRSRKMLSKFHGNLSNTVWEI